jgi:heme exporter protein CcmD
MTSFWMMGGYARYVWPCYGLTALMLAWNVWAARRFQAAARRRALRAIAMAADQRA